MVASSWVDEALSKMLCPSCLSDSFEFTVKVYGSSIKIIYRSLYLCIYTDENILFCIPVPKAVFTISIPSGTAF